MWKAQTVTRSTSRQMRQSLAILALLIVGLNGVLFFRGDELRQQLKPYVNEDVSHASPPDPPKEREALSPTKLPMIEEVDDSTKAPQRMSDSPAVLPTAMEPILGTASFIASMSTKVNWSLLDHKQPDLPRLILQLKDVMIDYILKMPLVDIKQDCGPDDSYLPITARMCAAASSTAFANGLRKTPARVGMLIQLGFDIDTLEIHLHELYDVVDKFFVIESSHTHLKGMAKPLMWQVLKETPRFKRFTDKVVGFTLDDADSLHSKGMWGLEERQESLRWSKFKTWNEHTKYFTEDDMLGFGDADEVPSRFNVQLMKYCVPQQAPIDVGIAFAMSHIDWMFRTDWPVSHAHPFALGDPTFYTLRAASASKTYPSRGRGQNSNFVLGGLHMTSYTYVPAWFLKIISCTECEGVSLTDLQLWRQWVMEGNVTKFESWARKAQEGRLTRVTMYDKITEEAQRSCRVIPWLLRCNPDRFPAWTWGSDSRLYK